MRDRLDVFGDAEIVVVTFAEARLLSGYRNRFVAPLTVLVIYGLVATELASMILGEAQWWRMVPTLILQAGLLWLFASSYHGWRLGPAATREAAPA